MRSRPPSQNDPVHCPQGLVDTPALRGEPLFSAPTTGAAVVAACLLLTSCQGLHSASGQPPLHSGPSAKTSGHPGPAEKESKAPGNFRMTLSLKNWRVVEAAPSTGIGLETGSFHYAGSVRNKPNVYFSFRSKLYPSHFWLVPVPETPDGTFTATAIRYSDPCDTCMSVGGPHTPPASVQLVVDVEGGYVQKHFILDPLPWWGHFVFSYLDREHHTLYLRNPRFPGFEWKAAYPERNGKWGVSLDLIQQ